MTLSEAAQIAAAFRDGTYTAADEKLLTLVALAEANQDPASWDLLRGLRLDLMDLRAGK